ncbi:fluoride efflux transporter FluC [Cellulomonas chengniuliangii]|uniref:Fluoride-specific ion channel FluC n=1 Tax=Cellulomonas chengniuliangii TaxID=2968084 RepID=A0ABY5KWI4_9CELL|nr:CrcB family protein [Cellulomonas chengniuliangii]MCC2310040.1 CrcB family protein [Cellulomonas chengniuliangii]UUI74564.1 CrcB family protein [Cellulomonas chengniuliangii]
MVVGVAVGSGVGAQLRFATERLHARARERRGLGRPSFPWATLTVNVVGSVALGAAAALAARGVISSPWLTVLGIGLAGGLTTFSTFALDVVSLARDHRVAHAVLDIALHLALGLGAGAAMFHILL